MIKTLIATAAAAAMLGAIGANAAERTVGQKIDNAAHKTAQATRNAAHKTKVATKKVAHKTVKVTKKAAHKTAQVTRKAAHKTANAARRVTNRPERIEAPAYRAETTREQRTSEAYANWQRNRKL